MTVFPCVIVAIGTLVWYLPFALTKWNSKTPGTIDRRARWGLVLQAAGYSLIWQSGFWTRTPGPSRLLLSMVFFGLAGMLSWTGARTLGRHLRVDAAVDADHKLIRSGPYRFIRHPIYASMLCIVLATGFVIAPLPLLLLSALVFLAGAEIRMRVEDRLLSMRFGDSFREYRRAVPRYIPFLR